MNILVVNWNLILMKISKQYYDYLCKKLIYFFSNLKYFILYIKVK